MINSKIFVFLSLLVIVFLYLFFFYSPQQRTINNAIDRGVDFLFRNQLNYGEFKTLLCKDDSMSDCYFDSSPYTTTYVLYSLKDINSKKVEIMKRKALNFLLSEKEPGGIWRYLSSRNPRHLYIPPDLDDTSLASFALESNGISVDNISLILSNKNEDGLFLTWFPNPYYTDVDCVVNTNVLLYLGKNDSNVCSKINEAILSNEKCSVYYSDLHPERLVLFYVVSRAYVNRVTCFQESKNKIINTTLSLQKPDGSFGSAFKTALALNALMNFGYNGREVERGVLSLLQKQSNGGFWDKDIFFFDFEPEFYGSEELSTAFAIEALQKYSQLNL